MKFRKDINGLRAIAVIAVVLFHFNPAWTPGGFVGVDVFFVISGFLMTGIIFRGIEQENFSIMKFYIARANRIVPALAILCLILLALSWAYLSPMEYRSLAKHVSGSMVFLSNIIYWKESGYFDAASHGKWLLHTWSLSVEWQFYIIYPLALIIMRKIMSLKLMKITIVIGVILSFVFCVFATYRWPDASYYLLPTRVWEMMFGGIAYLYPFTLQEKNKKLVEWLGLFLIIGSYAFISKELLWPGTFALFPVLGAFFIIQSQRHDSLITNNVLFQKLGSWSYSIYLWHWPIVVSIYYFSLSEMFIYLGIGLSILLGYLSNKYFEKINFKSDSSKKFNYFRISAVHISVVVFSLGLLAYKHLFCMYNIPAHIANGMIVDKNTNNNGRYTWDKHLQLDKKITFKENKLKVLIIGDSQSGDFINMLFQAGVNNVDILSRKVEAKCGAFYLNNEMMLDLLSKQNLKQHEQNVCKKSMLRLKESEMVNKADIIIFSMLWKVENIPFILKSIFNISINNRNAKLYLVGVKRFSQSIPQMLYESYIKGDNINDYAFNKIPYQNKSLNDIFEKNQATYDYKYINMTDVLCENEKCFVSNANHDLYYYDSNHTTILGNKFLGNKIKSKNILPFLIFD